MANCVTCGKQLHPERAEKYNYCTDRECQKRNAKGLTILAMGVNKAQDQYEVLNERTRDRISSGRYVEEVTTGTGTGTDTQQDRSKPHADQPRRTSKPRPKRSRPAPAAAAPQPRPARWTKAQQDLAVIYNARGMRPDEIAKTLGLDTHTVTEMILAGRNRSKP